MIELPDYLQSKIQPEPNSGCWLWLGATNDDDYGSVGVPRQRKIIAAHRAVYMFYKGAIPQGLVLDHTCRTHCCVNPDHLEAVTHQINILRGEGPAAKNALKTICENGHSLENAIITRRGQHMNRHCRECNKIGQKKYQQKTAARRRVEEREAMMAWINARVPVDGAH